MRHFFLLIGSMQQDHEQAGADGLAPRQALIEHIADLTCDLQRAQRIAELTEGLQSAKQPTADPDELLDAMQELSDAFYLRAIRIGVHPFIEFAWLMNEYIKCCRIAHERGINFADCNKHSGQHLPMESFQVRYVNEKLECIFTGRSIVTETAIDSSKTAG